MLRTHKHAIVSPFRSLDLLCRTVHTVHLVAAMRPVHGIASAGAAIFLAVSARGLAEGELGQSLGFAAFVSI